MADEFNYQRVVKAVVFRDREGKKHISRKVINYTDINDNPCVKLEFLDDTYITITEEMQEVATKKEGEK